MPGAATAGDMPAGYSIVRPIGSGGGGRIYLAVQAATGRQVALKLYGQDITDESTRASFHRECAAAQALGAVPFIVPVYEAGLAGNRPWIAMEYIERGSLADLVAAAGPLPPPEAVRLTARLADALRVLHDAGVLHGDIKPGNILLASGVDGVPEPLFADFGLAAVTSARASMTMEAFSPPYAAPETLDGGRYAVESEIWGLGAVLYELLAGTPPFLPAPREGVVPFTRRVLRDDPAEAPLAHVPEPVRAVVRQALAKRREDRPASAADVAGRLRDAQRAAGWPVTPPPAAGEARLARDTIAGARAARTVLRPRPPAAPPAAATTQASARVAAARRRRRVLAVVAALVVTVTAASTGLAWGTMNRRPAVADPAPAPAVSSSGSASASATGTARPPVPPSSPGSIAPPAPPSGGSAGRSGPPPPGQTADLPDARSVPAAGSVVWRTFGSGVTATGEPASQLTITTPERDYADLRGVALQANVCDARIEFDAQLVAPRAASPGYGIAIAPRGGLSGDDPVGWSIQLEWDGARNAFHQRVATLPAQAAQATTTFPLGIGAGTWFRVAVVVSGGTVSVSVGGTAVTGSPFRIDAGCGSPLLRVWGGVVHVRALRFS